MRWCKIHIRCRPGTRAVLAWVPVTALLAAGVAVAPAPVQAGGCGNPAPLSIRQSGLAVLALQAGLRDLGLDPGPLDGIYGPLTAAAVRKLQEQEQLPRDGVAGQATLQALREALSRVPHAPYVPPAEGKMEVLVDLSRRRLTVLLNGYPIRTYPVAIGKSRTPSPVGRWKVIHKSRDWGGGFGTRWIGLNVPWGLYGIHGTDKPWAIGQSVSGGCIRMHNRQVEELYDLIPIGTPVTIAGGPTFQRPALVQGHRGHDVMEVQMRLAELGFYKGPLDGVYGPATARAVTEFQRARGLQPTGIVRWDTYRALGLMD